MQILLLPEHHSAHIPIAWGFLHLAIRRAAVYDVLCFLVYCRDMLVSRTVCLMYFSFSEKKILTFIRN